MILHKTLLGFLFLWITRKLYLEKKQQHMAMRQQKPEQHCKYSKFAIKCYEAGWHFKSCLFQVLQMKKGI